MCFVVELVEDELTVQPIHRLITGLPEGAALHLLLSEHFDVEPTDGFGADAVARLVQLGGMGLVDDTGSFVLRPKAGAFADAVGRATVRLDHARDGRPPQGPRYPTGENHAAEALGDGWAMATVHVRPAPVPDSPHLSHGCTR